MNNNIYNQNNLYINNNEYIADLLKNNIGKYGIFYLSFCDAIEWRDSIFEGVIEQAGKDYVLIYNSKENKRYLLWMIYINYVIFNEMLN